MAREMFMGYIECVTMFVLISPPPFTGWSMCDVMKLKHALSQLPWINLEASSSNSTYRRIGFVSFINNDEKENEFIL
jgi:hypothetical protein